jgi:hypothetical protein
MKNTTEQTEDEGIDTIDSELHELFIGELSDIMSAEQQLIQDLPKNGRSGNIRGTDFGV